MQQTASFGAPKSQSKIAITDNLKPGELNLTWKASPVKEIKNELEESMKKSIKHFEQIKTMKEKQNR